MKIRITKWVYTIGLIIIGLGGPVQTALAHGEKALEPFIRMRTIQWYDVAWSKQQFKVNEEVTVSGRFHVAEDWPVSVPKPDAAFLNVSTPGPVLIRTERWLNGKPWVNSVALQPGGDYEFKIVLKGRLPGRYHIHPFFNLKDAGQVMGPGAWLDISGNAGDFSNEVRTLNGEIVDMESVGLFNGIGWHLFWGVLATAWLLWWVRRPLFISRYRMLQAGMEDELITVNDRLIAKVVLAAVPVAVLAINAVTVNRYPNAIPLQASLDQVLPLSAQVNAGQVDAEAVKAEYIIAKRMMIFTVRVNNRSDKPVQLGEFNTANVSFINPELPAASQVSTIEATLRLDDNTPIRPGEERTISVTAQDALWETEKLDGLINDADSRVGGLLFLYDSESGERYISSVSAAVIPKF
ncbi:MULTISPECIES: bacterial ammonia monooxygenase, subunit AmoB [Methylomicrobium]|uniref:Methane monooxygenase/ammonia monooxygenase, subunit B n=1 Tax=Methylomicrobium album BG8 TaxID=686340 RepID=H8GK94_METAL|nr:MULTISPECIES: bacterial ammonia monooxygenase, subunit AmoB [Methylomicrobium]EIC29218.1 methane monooxygenase/ammonia monooxygenase, subunit B [Methylomicrobium album BG8]